MASARPSDALQLPPMEVIFVPYLTDLLLPEGVRDMGFQLIFPDLVMGRFPVITEGHLGFATSARMMFLAAHCDDLPVAAVRSRRSLVLALMTQLLSRPSAWRQALALTSTRRDAERACKPVAPRAMGAGGREPALTSPLLVARRACILAEPPAEMQGPALTSRW